MLFHCLGRDFKPWSEYAKAILRGLGSLEQDGNAFLANWLSIRAMRLISARRCRQQVSVARSLA
jgi:hypothetical protein